MAQNQNRKKPVKECLQSKREGYGNLLRKLPCLDLLLGNSKSLMVFYFWECCRLNYFLNHTYLCTLQ